MRCNFLRGSSIVGLLLLVLAACSSNGNEKEHFDVVDAEAVLEDTDVGVEAIPEEATGDIRDASDDLQRDCNQACEGRQCGADPRGCGVPCGDCSGAYVCDNTSGQCVCPTELCGGDCCDGEEICFENSCCTSSCPLGACGGDGCGAVCGPCVAHQKCEAGMCVPVTCGGTDCPPTPPGHWALECNVKEACEYSRIDDDDSQDLEIYVPNGAFSMGAPTDECEYFEYACPHERPVREVSIDDGYWVDKYEVTNAQFERCVSASACEPPLYCPDGPSEDWVEPGLAVDYRRNHPVRCVTRAMASQFCSWLGKSLPSEAMWERAATGNDHRRYPWGEDIATCEHANILNCQFIGGPVDVGSTPAGASTWGVQDLSGNVSEWVLDCYHDSYENAPTDGSAWMDDCTGDSVVRGGSSFAGPPHCRTASRSKGPETNVDPAYGSSWSLGFRCVRHTAE